MVDFSRFSNVFFIIVAVILGIIIPSYGYYIQPFVTILVIFLVYSIFYTFQLNVSVIFSDVKFIFISFGFSFFILPIVGGHVMRIFFPEPVFIGFVILLVAPTTAVSAVWTRFSQGDVQLATSITIGSVLLSPVVTPLFLIYFIGPQMSVPVISILYELTIVIVGGALLTVILPSYFSKQRINLGAKIALLIIIYASAAQVDFSGFTFSQLFAISSAAMMALIFGGIVFIWIHYQFNIPEEKSVAMYFSSNMKNLGIALLIGSFVYSDPHTITTIIIYFLLQQISSALISDYVS